MSVNQQLKDSAVRHQIYLQRYASFIVNKALKLLSSTQLSVADKLRLSLEKSYSDGFIKKSDLNSLLKAIKEEIAAGYVSISQSVIEELEQLVEYEAAYHVNSLSKAIPGEVAVVLGSPSNSLLVAQITKEPSHGKLLKEWISELSDGEYKRIRDTVRIGVGNGYSTDEIVRSIVGTKKNNYQDGIGRVARRDVSTFIRTVTNDTANTVRESVYKKNQSVIKGVEWVSTLDGRTSSVCRIRDGKVYEVDQGERPPAHPNCRSTTTPVLKSWKELGIDKDELSSGTRASMDGQVSADETYESWLRKQPRSFVESVLGKTKSKVFLDGKLKLESFADKSGAEYSLAELRNRESYAFKKAAV